MKRDDFLKNWFEYNGKDLTLKKTQRWVCLFVGTTNELSVAYHLRKNDLPFFLPIYKDLQDRFHSLFPGYIFTRIGPESINYVEHLCNKILYVGYPSEEKHLLNQLAIFSEYYEYTIDFKVGDSVFLDIHGLNDKLLYGDIIGLNDFSNDVVVKIPFFKRETKVTISKDLISHKNHERKIFRPSGKEILSEKFISLDEHISIKEPLNIILNNVNLELINFLKHKPEYIYQLDSRKFEELIAELLHDMGYEIHITPQTRDGGRDIIAAIDLPPNRKILTLVECKKYAAHRKIGIDIVERFLWVLKQKFDTNGGLIVTTSYYTQDARKVQQQYSQNLSLYDFDSMNIWLKNYGNWEKNATGSIWIPKDKFIYNSYEKSSVNKDLK